MRLQKGTLGNGACIAWDSSESGHAMTLAAVQRLPASRGSAFVRVPEPVSAHKGAP